MVVLKFTERNIRHTRGHPKVIDVQVNIRNNLQFRSDIVYDDLSNHLANTLRKIFCADSLLVTYTTRSLVYLCRAQVISFDQFIVYLFAHSILWDKIESLFTEGYLSTHKRALPSMTQQRIT